MNVERHVPQTRESPQSSITRLWFMSEFVDSINDYEKHLNGIIDTVFANNLEQNTHFQCNSWVEPSNSDIYHKRTK